MDKILEFILSYTSFLYKKYEFKFVDSLVGESFGGDAYLTLSSKNLDLRFLHDRGQLFLDFHSKIADKENSWHSIDVIKELISGDISDNSELNADYASFLNKQFHEIYTLFEKENAHITVTKLKNLEKQRAKRIFG